MNPRIVRILFAAAVVMMTTVTGLSAQGLAKFVIKKSGVWMNSPGDLPCPPGPGYCEVFIVIGYAGLSPVDLDYTLAPSNIKCAVSLSQGLAYVQDITANPLPSQWQPFPDAIVQPNIDLDHP